MARRDETEILRSIESSEESALSTVEMVTWRCTKLAARLNAYPSLLGIKVCIRLQIILFHIKRKPSKSSPSFKLFLVETLAPPRPQYKVSHGSQCTRHLQWSGPEFPI